MVKKIDLITIELIGNALLSITEEMGVALIRTSYSTNIKERKDCSTAIFDTDENTIAQTIYSPLHLGSMLGLIKEIKKRYSLADIQPGDMFISNDPFVGGGSHLPDVAIVIPVFYEGELVMYAANIAHHADIGGSSPGSMAGDMTEIYQEGLRIPPIKVIKNGEIIKDIMDIITLNCRLPKERMGDFQAQFGANKLANRRIQEIYKKYNKDIVNLSMKELLDRTEQKVRMEIKKIPDGIYKFKDYMDDDGFGNNDIPLQVKIMVKNDSIFLDFSGSASQVKGNINVSTSGLLAAVYYTMISLLDPHSAVNAGFHRAIDIKAEEGSILNATFPAATAGRAQTCQRVVDLILGALADAIPEKVIAAANGANTTWVFYGRKPQNKSFYVYLETIGGGMGGRARKDGKDGVQVYTTNTSNLPIESLESEYPLLVEQYSLIPNSGGAGKFRGGLGLRRDIRPLAHKVIFSGQADRFRLSPWGIFGGKKGKPGRFVLNPDMKNEKVLSSKISDLEVTPDDIISVQTPGAGGYGPPETRDLKLILKDVIEGKISKDLAEKEYNVKIDLKNRKIMRS